MLWMGEEWAASTRWPFFTSHPEPELAEATGKGRVEEFADHGWDVSADDRPAGSGAYRTAILDWPELGQAGARAELLALYRELIALRAAEPDLRDADLDPGGWSTSTSRRDGCRAPRRVARGREPRARALSRSSGTATGRDRARDRRR